MLGANGQNLYDALIDGRDVNAAHKIMALNAARIADMLDNIQQELIACPNLTVINSQGTETANPLITEARQLTSTLSQILSKLGVAALPEPAQGDSRLDDLARRRAERQAARASNAANSL